MAWSDPNTTHNPSTGATIPTSWGDMVNGNLDFLKEITESVAVLVDSKSVGNDGGTFTSGAWRTRDLNTELSDASAIVSISSNQFTPEAGTYLAIGIAPAFRVDRHQARFYNATAVSGVGGGQNAYSASTDGTTTASMVWTVFTANGTDAYELQHVCELTRSGDGFGVDLNITGASASTYAIVILIRLND